MLQHHAEKAFHRAADGAVDHHRRLLRTVGGDVEGLEPLRQVEVHLRGAALPVAADGIAQHIFEFRTVEGAFARIDRGLDLPVAALRFDLLQHILHDAFGMIPGFLGADALFRPGRELHRHLALEAEIGVGAQDQIVDLETLLGHLLLGAEHMRVVLGEGANAHQAVQGARRLVAMHDAEFGHAQRQFAIGAQAVLENLDMARAVHRLDREDALVLGLVARGFRHEHVFAEPAPMAGRLPQRLVEQLRRVDFLIVALQAAAHIGDDFLEHGPAGRMPEHRARTFLLEMEQIHLAAELAMVALLGLFHVLDDIRRALPAWRTPCRRCATASRGLNRRANRRPRPSSA